MQSSGGVTRARSEVVLPKHCEAAKLWELFWAQAGTDGCTALFPPAAQQAIAAKWRCYFAGLHPRSSILDIATGRGAVLAHAQVTRPNGPTFRLAGVDLAEARLGAGPWMEYHGGVDAALLPFSDQSFDRVTSQFGIEYAGFEPALREAARVCRSGMKLLIHAAEGVVVRQNQIQADQVDWIVNELRLPDRLADHFARPSTKAASEIDLLLGEIRKRGETDENVTLLESVHSAAMEIQQHWELNGLRRALEAIAGLAGQLILHRERMRLLGGAGVERARIEAATADLRTRGFGDAMVEEEMFGADNHLVGYWLDATRTNKGG